MRKEIQAKHVTDLNLLRAVEASGIGTRDAICAQFGELPAKVVNSKLRQAVRKGLLSGCKLDTCARRGKCLNQCGGVYKVVTDGL